MTIIPPEYLNQIVTGDARELAQRIPDESVDLIFTDPIYDRIDDYRWLAETAKRVLKPNAALLCWSNGKWHHTNARWMEDAGLVYRWDFASIHHGGSSPMNGKIISKTNRLMWFDVDGSSEMIGYVPDGHLSKPWGFDHQEHKWTKNPRLTAIAIRGMCVDIGIVFDPFTGGGTVPAVCKMLGRNFIAFEIDPDTAEKDRERVRNTQPPLFVMPPSQDEMEFGS